MEWPFCLFAGLLHWGENVKPKHEENQHKCSHTLPDSFKIRIAATVSFLHEEMLCEFGESGREMDGFSVLGSPLFYIHLTMCVHVYAIYVEAKGESC